MKESKNYQVRIVKRTYENNEIKFVVQAKLKGQDDRLWMDTSQSPNKNIEAAEKCRQEFIEWENARSKTIKNEEVVG